MTPDHTPVKPGCACPDGHMVSGKTGVRKRREEACTKTTNLLRSCWQLGMIHRIEKVGNHSPPSDAPAESTRDPATRACFKPQCVPDEWQQPCKFRTSREGDSDLSPRGRDHRRSDRVLHRPAHAFLVRVSR